MSTNRMSMALFLGAHIHDLHARIRLPVLAGAIWPSAWLLLCVRSVPRYRLDRGRPVYFLRVMHLSPYTFSTCFFTLVDTHVTHQHPPVSPEPSDGAPTSHLAQHMCALGVGLSRFVFLFFVFPYHSLLSRLSLSATTMDPIIPLSASGCIVCNASSSSPPVIHRLIWWFLWTHGAHNSVTCRVSKRSF